MIKESEITQEHGYSYRRVHYTKEDKFKSSFWSREDVFNDPEWKKEEIDIQNIDPRREVILRRLEKLYNNRDKPQFFPGSESAINKNLNPKEVPCCLSEMNLLEISHYKSLFLTQDFQETGLYHILINIEGRWETDVVDDYIPIYKDTEEPIWGMDIEQPWSLILLKFWAKRFRGYAPLIGSQPM